GAAPPLSHDPVTAPPEPPHAQPEPPHAQPEPPHTPPEPPHTPPEPPGGETGKTTDDGFDRRLAFDPDAPDAGYAPGDPAGDPAGGFDPATGGTPTYAAPTTADANADGLDDSLQQSMYSADHEPVTTASSGTDGGWDPDTHHGL